MIRLSHRTQAARSKRAKQKKLKPGDIITLTSVHLINPPKNQLLTPKEFDAASQNVWDRTVERAKAKKAEK